MTANALKSVSFDKAFTSDLRRAPKTAERILQCHTQVDIDQYYVASVGLTSEN
ncbi:hypothetical protein BDR05DRAFT_969680 [Suillus weaverae]|nr:hypothetical protein BDR05DRAFT_969680 [Suillus weaverae]